MSIQMNTIGSHPHCWIKEPSGHHWNFGVETGSLEPAAVGLEKDQGSDSGRTFVTLA